MFDPMDTPMSTTAAAMTPAARYARSRTQWSPQIQAICDQYDDSMRGHYEWLTQQVVQFQQDKAALIAALWREGEAEHGSPHAADAGSAFDGMLPACLTQLLALVMITREPVEDSGLPAASADIPQAQQDKQAVMPPSPTTPVFGSDAPMPSFNPFLLAASKLGHQPGQASGRAKTGKNKAPTRPPSGSHKTMASYFANKTERPENTAATFSQGDAVLQGETTCSRPRLAPASPPINTWEVEAAEYIFSYAPFGPGWFVLRCARGMDLPAVVFEASPLAGRALGMAHFSDDACKYHAHKEYTEEQMMVAYARRVVDEEGDDVTADWAAESNEHLAETVARRAKDRERRRRRRKSGSARTSGESMAVAKTDYSDAMPHLVQLSDDDASVVYDLVSESSDESCDEV